MNFAYALCPIPECLIKVYPIGVNFLDIVFAAAAG